MLRSRSGHAGRAGRGASVAAAGNRAVLPVACVVGLGDHARMHAGDDADAGAHTADRLRFAGAVDAALRPVGSDLDLVPGCDAEPFGGLGGHHGVVRVDDLRGVLPIRRASLRVHVPLERREHELVVLEVLVLRDAEVERDVARVRVVLRKAHRPRGEGEDRSRTAMRREGVGNHDHDTVQQDADRAARSPEASRA